MRWTAENNTAASEIQRNGSSFHTSGTPPKGLPCRPPEVLRSASQIALARRVSTSVATPATAIMASAHCQPTVTARAGAVSDTITPPSGTPVCLIENTRLRRSGGVCLTSRCAAAGAASPMPMPTATDPNAMRPTCGIANSPRPATAHSMANWVADAAPQRITARPP
ncbi:hypothetical protein D3C83_04420 [compost metagenome]